VPLPEIFYSRLNLFPVRRDRGPLPGSPENVILTTLKHSLAPHLVAGNLNLPVVKQCHGTVRSETPCSTSAPTTPRRPRLARRPTKNQ
jgi:hypothetical protein